MNTKLFSFILTPFVVFFLSTTFVYGQCSTTNRGDANCDGKIDLADFEMWRKESLGILTTKNADFDGNGTVSLPDFETWRKTYTGSGSGNPTATPTTGGQATQTPTPTTGTVTPPPGGGSIWLSRDEISKLPMSGTAWDSMKSAADSLSGSAQIVDQDSKHDVQTLAAALVYARTGQATYRTKAATAVMSAIGSEKGGSIVPRTLALGRNLVSYVIAADLIDLKSYNSSDDQKFRTWLSAVRKETLEGKTLISTQEDRPNNWGLHAAASRAAADVYLGDKTDLDRTAQVFKGWLGDRAAYAGFTYGELWWQCDESKPVGVNPVGCTKNGQNIDGALPDDMRRGGSFKWPPGYTDYPWGALEGAIVAAEILHRQGYDSWNWQNQAIKRAVQFLYNLGGSWLPDGDDVFMPWVVNKAYGTSFKTVSPVQPGKNMGWTDWTHAK